MYQIRYGSLLALACLGAFDPAHADPIVLTPIANHQKDMSWQEIRKTTYSFLDANTNNLIDVGETVSFTVEMDKWFWGRHDFDALKVWLTPTAAPSDVLLTANRTWNFSNTNSWRDDRRRWYGGTRSFSFDYTFTNAGLYDFTASVMCSADLSDLVGAQDDRPTAADWNAWTRNIHTLPGWRQGETEIYRLQVVETPAVPEPGSLALLLLGLSGMAGVRFYRRRK